MRVVGWEVLESFWKRHPRAEPPLTAWYSIMVARSFASPMQLRQNFSSASMLGGGCTVFNIGGNKFRLVARINYAWKTVDVQRVLTHEQYDRIPEGQMCE